jgi:hypothetical protein
MREDPPHRQNGAIGGGQSAKCQGDPRERRGDRIGLGWAYASRPSPFPRQFGPPFLECEDDSTLSTWRRRHS